MVFAIDGKLGVDTTRVDDAQEFTLGACIQGSDGCHYEYIKADEDLAAGATVAIREDYGAVELTTTVSGSVPTSVGVPQVAIANDKYGWAVRKGSGFQVLAAASCAADVTLYTTATAGVVDDAATDKISGLRLDATNGGSQALVSASAATFMGTNL